MSRLPIPHIINTIKAKLGFDRTMTASGQDVVDAVNKQSQQIAKLTPIYLTNVFTATHPSVGIAYQFAAIIGDVIIGTISFVISANIADGAEIFVFTDPTRLWDSTTLYSVTVRVNDNTALPLLLKIIKNTNQITAYSNIETNVARWSSITFVGKIKEV